MCSLHRHSDTRYCCISEYFVHFAGVLQVLGSLALYLGSVKVSRIMHHKLLSNVVASPMMFFDTTPSGRILNRFGKDIDAIDSVIAPCALFWMMCTLRVVFTVIVVTMTTPLILSAVVPSGLLYLLIQVITSGTDVYTSL